MAGGPSRGGCVRGMITAVFGAAEGVRTEKIYFLNREYFLDRLK